jgi:hypothetical protein
MGLLTNAGRYNYLPTYTVGEGAAAYEVSENAIMMPKKKLAYSQPPAIGSTGNVFTSGTSQVYFEINSTYVNIPKMFYLVLNITNTNGSNAGTISAYNLLQRLEMRLNESTIETFYAWTLMSQLALLHDYSWVLNNAANLNISPTTFAGLSVASGATVNVVIPFTNIFCDSLLINAIAPKLKMYCFFSNNFIEAGSAASSDFTLNYASMYCVGDQFESGVINSLVDRFSRSTVVSRSCRLVDATYTGVTCLTSQVQKEIQGLTGSIAALWSYLRASGGSPTQNSVSLATSFWTVLDGNNIALNTQQAPTALFDAIGADLYPTYIPGSISTKNIITYPLATDPMRLFEERVATGQVVFNGRFQYQLYPALGSSTLCDIVTTGVELVAWVTMPGGGLDLLYE